MFYKMLLYILIAQVFSVMVCKCSLLNEIIQISNLVKHYQNHSEANEDMSLMEFFDMHYLQETVHDADYAEDMQLPFKSEHKLLQHYQFNVVVSNIEYVFLAIQVVSERIHVADVSAKALKVANVIWQPPKF